MSLSVRLWFVHVVTTIALYISIYLLTYYTYSEWRRINHCIPVLSNELADRSRVISAHKVYMYITTVNFLGGGSFSRRGGGHGTQVVAAAVASINFMGNSFSRGENICDTLGCDRKKIAKFICPTCMQRLRRGDPSEFRKKCLVLGKSRTIMLSYAEENMTHTETT